MVWKLDRLGRSVRDLITLVSELQDRGIHFRSLTDSIDTSTPAGRFFFHVMSALAEMERELIVERTRAGLAVAREQGRVGGRRRVMTEEVVERCRRMLENRRYPATDRRCDRRGREKQSTSTSRRLEDKDFTTFPDMLRLA